MGNWANDLARGFGQGAYIGEAVNKRAEARKTSKEAAVIAKEQDDSLFNIEDKGPISNWAYDTLGLGSPPTKTLKKAMPAAGTPGAPAAAPAAAPPSDARAMAADGAQMLMQAGAPKPAPEMLAMEEIGITPVAPPQFAAMTPLVTPPEMSPVEQKRPSVRQKIQEWGIG